MMRLRPGDLLIRNRWNHDLNLEVILVLSQEELRDILDPLCTILYVGTFSGQASVVQEASGDRNDWVLYSHYSLQPEE